MQQLLNKPWVQDLSAIYCSDEQKAIDGAQILADHCKLTFTCMAELGENDRSSTGFLEPEEFERTADQFFTNPDQSIRGWETASSAQARVVNAVSVIAGSDSSAGAIAIVSHGAVGTLLYCYLNEEIIGRRWDQPGQGGGNFMVVEMADKSSGNQSSCSWWRPID